MKKWIITAALMLPVAAVAEEVQDTIVNYNGKQIVISDDSLETQVRVYNADGNQWRKTRETAFVNQQEVERVYITSPFIPSTYNDVHFAMMQPSLWYGWRTANNGLGRHNNNHTTGIHTRDAGSFEVGMTMGEGIFPLDRAGQFGLSLAWQLGYARQQFQHSALLSNQGHRVAFADISDAPASTNYVHYNFYRLPIQLVFGPGRQYHKDILDTQVSIGLTPEYRGYARYRFEPKAFGDATDQKFKLYHWGLQLNIGICLGAVKLQAAYDLLPQFRTVNGNRCHTTTISVGFNIGELFKKKSSSNIVERF